MNKDFSTLNNFDILRLIFAVLVFLFHSAFLFGFVTNNILFNMSKFAVQGFFIISGFLICWSFDKNNDILKYSVKRFFRIYPLYFFLILIQTLILVLVSSGFNISGIFKYLSSNLIFLNFLSPSIGGVLNHLKINAINGSLWTLKIEVIFYILLPVIYYLFKKFKSSFLICLYVLSAFYFISVKGDFWSTLFPAHLRFFIVGIMLYFYGLRFVEALKGKMFFSLLLLSIFMFLDLYINTGIFKAFIYPITLGFTVLLSAFCLPPVKVPLDISYSVYVIHFPVIQLLMLFNIFHNNYQLFLLSSSLIIFTLSILSAIFIEKPFINLGHKLAKENNLISLFKKFSQTKPLGLEGEV